MYKIFSLFLAACLYSGSLFADSLAISGDSDLEDVLSQHQGKRVTVKLTSGDELTGIVGSQNDEIVQLKELAGREFFDAAVEIDEITAVIVRTKK